MENKANLFQPITATHIGPPPVVIRTVITANNDYIAGGMPQSSVRGEAYVLLSSLPTDLQDRVRTAVQSLISGM